MKFVDCVFKAKVGHFSLNVEIKTDKSVVGIYGPSGSGKSTLFKYLLGSLTNCEGHFSLNNRVLFDSEKEIMVSRHLRRLSCAFQDFLLFPHLTVKSNLLFAYRDSPRVFMQPEELVDLLEIEHLLNKKPSQLSGGERRRVTLGRALLADCDMILLDEPMESIDTKLVNKISPKIFHLLKKSDRTVFYAGHDLNHLTRYTDELISVNKGKIRKK